MKFFLASRVVHQCLSAVMCHLDKRAEILIILGPDFLCGWTPVSRLLSLFGHGLPVPLCIDPPRRKFSSPTREPGRFFGPPVTPLGFPKLWRTLKPPNLVYFCAYLFLNLFSFHSQESHLSLMPYDTTTTAFKGCAFSIWPTCIFPNRSSYRTIFFCVAAAVLSEGFFF